MTGTALWAATLSLAGAAAGWALVPAASRFALQRAYRRYLHWWWDSCRAYRAFKDGHPGREPLSSAPGEEGALGIWREDAVQAALAGTLPREREEALRAVGISLDAGGTGYGEADREQRFSYAALPWHRAVLACGGALVGGGLAMAHASALAAAAFALCMFAMAVAVVCDLHARMLPLECCAVVAAAGAAFQLVVAGWDGLAAGAAFGAVVSLGCAAANRVIGRIRGAPVGWGDVRCMAALSLATGGAAPVGFAACYAASAVFSLAGLAARKLTVRDGIPMAPFLVLWLGAGAALGLSA